MASLATVLADAFNPLGGSAPALQIAAPTVLDPFVALAQNKDWTGRPIYIENFSALNPEPGFNRTKDSATPWAKGLAEAIDAMALGPVEVRVLKVRDRSGSGVKFNSALVPPYVRRPKTIAAALPWQYLNGITSGDMHEALTVLVGEDARGLSPNVVSRLKAQWAGEYAEWMKRDLSGCRYLYWWADGIHTSVREEDGSGSCLLVIIGVTAAGTKELVSIGDGLRESAASWLELLRDLKARGLARGPLLAVGDGPLGFWAALDQIDPETRAQRCWVHKSASWSRRPRRAGGAFGAPNPSPICSSAWSSRTAFRRPTIPWNASRWPPDRPMLMECHTADWTIAPIGPEDCAIVRRGRGDQGFDAPIMLEMAAGYPAFTERFG